MSKIWRGDTALPDSSHHTLTDPGKILGIHRQDTRLIGPGMYTNPCYLVAQRASLDPPFWVQISCHVLVTLAMTAMTMITRAALNTGLSMLADASSRESPAHCVHDYPL